MSSLPKELKAEIDFLDTSFFHSDNLDSPQLPAPSAILGQYSGLEGGVVVKYENLNLAVKFEESTYGVHVCSAAPSVEAAYLRTSGWL